jgi:hypothetical protein
VDHAHELALFVAGIVRRVQALARLDDDPGDDPHVEHLPGLREPRHHARERDAVEVLHGDEPRAGDLAVRVHVADVLVVEPAREVRLVAEHRDEVIILGEVRQDALQDDDVVALRRSARAREKDLGHPARRELRDELILAEISGVAGDDGPRRNRHEPYYVRGNFGI